MEFHEKLQELRRRKGITQEELAESLYVSRTAISKWESGRGYPNIDSLKAISRFFGITVDELLSGEELLTLAAEDHKQKVSRVRDLVFGGLDVSLAMLFFLPFFATRTGNTVHGSSLIALNGVQLYLKVAYFALVIGMVFIGVLTLALQNFRASAWIKSKTKISIALGILSALFFVLSLQPYAAIFTLALLAIKVFLLIKQR